MNRGWKFSGKELFNDVSLNALQSGARDLFYLERIEKHRIPISRDVLNLK